MHVCSVVVYINKMLCILYFYYERIDKASWDTSTQHVWMSVSPRIACLEATAAAVYV